MATMLRRRGARLVQHQGLPGLRGVEDPTLGTIHQNRRRILPPERPPARPAAAATRCRARRK
jgi:hypothetical protein